MAYTRRLAGDGDADTDSILMGCSICGFTFRYPTEIRYCEDKLFRCNVFCTETTTPLGEARKQGLSLRKDEGQIPFPVGPKPDWYP